MPGLASDPRRSTHIRHGLTPAAVDAMARRQGGLCILCQGPLPDPAIIDHDHQLAVLHGHDAAVGCPRCVRGLTCSRCNTLLGMAHDDDELLMRAALYLTAARDAHRRMYGR